VRGGASLKTMIGTGWRTHVLGGEDEVGGYAKNTGSRAALGWMAACVARWF
jgi:hypothetical protein